MIRERRLSEVILENDWKKCNLVFRLVCFLVIFFIRVKFDI